MAKKLIFLGVIFSSLFSYDTSIFYDAWIKKLIPPTVKIASDLHDDRLRVYIITKKYMPWLQSMGLHLSINTIYRIFRTNIDMLVSKTPYRYDVFTNNRTNFTHGGHITLKVFNPKQPKYIFGYDVMQIHDITDVAVFRKLIPGKYQTIQQNDGKVEYYDLNNLSSFSKVICLNAGKAHKDYKKHPDKNKKEMLLTYKFVIPSPNGGYAYKGKDQFSLACKQIRKDIF